MTDRRERIFQRMMDKVFIDHDGPLTNGHPCWLWTGATSGEPKPGDRNSRGHSYPRMSLNGATVAVHLVMWTHVYGYIPPRKTIDHECKRRLCIHPAHLSLVSHKENVRRRDGKPPRKNSEYGVGLPADLATAIAAMTQPQYKCEAA